MDHAVPDTSTKPVKPGIPPKPVVLPREAQWPVMKYTNLSMVNGRGVTNGKVAGRTVQRLNFAELKFRG